jgi:hypothetical protein
MQIDSRILPTVNGNGAQHPKSTIAVIIATVLDQVARHHPGIDIAPLAKAVAKALDVGGAYVGIARRLSPKARREVLDNLRPVIMPRTGAQRVHVNGNGAA